MEFAELQEKARSLGIKKVHAVSRKQLEEQIAQAEANKKASTESPAPKNEANTVVVLDQGKQEVRRYTLDNHGENFVELAKEFANKRDYTLQFKNVRAGVPCPSCGYVIYPDGE